jgi:hypothetical protein
MGVVDRNPVGGFVEFRYRDPRARERNADAWGLDGGHDSAGFNLDHRAAPVDSRGCPDCGVRDLPVAVLVEAFEEGRAKVAL